MAGAQRDSRFCNSFRDAAGSVCRTIAEGFGRFGSAHIVQFFTYALPSLNEVEDHLEECRIRGLLDPARFSRDWDMAEHIRAMSLNFIKPHRKRAARGEGKEGKCYWYAPPRNKKSPVNSTKPVST
jgi:four helix bundle protein